MSEKLPGQRNTKTSANAAPKQALPALEDSPELMHLSRLSESGHAYTPRQIMQMQRVLGNRASIQLLRKGARAQVQRKPEPIQRKRPPGTIFLQRKKKEMKLDFVVMKRKDAHIGLAIMKNMGKNVGQGDLYGHWWVEVGDLVAGTTWTPTKSYGWWPSHGVNAKQTLQGVPGLLNRGNANDPHHNDNANVSFHPTMMVDDKLDYDTVRNQVVSNIDAFAQGFKGSWNWRGPWGKNCHTFQSRLKKKLGLHNRSSKYMLQDPKQKQAAKALEDAKAAQEAARNHQERPEPFMEVDTNTFLDLFVDDQRSGLKRIGMERPGTRIGLTDVIKNFPDGKYMRIKLNSSWAWVYKHDLDKMLSTMPEFEQYQQMSTAPDFDAGSGGEQGDASAVGSGSEGDDSFE